MSWCNHEKRPSAHPPVQGSICYSFQCSSISIAFNFVRRFSNFDTYQSVLPWCLANLTHWGRYKMANISQTTFSNAYSWMKIHQFRLIFHWSLFLRVELTIFQHWFRLSEPMMLSLLMHICVTRPQWVKSIGETLYTSRGDDSVCDHMIHMSLMNTFNDGLWALQQVTASLLHLSYQRCPWCVDKGVYQTTIFPT